MEIPWPVGLAGFLEGAVCAHTILSLAADAAISRHFPVNSAVRSRRVRAVP